MCCGRRNDQESKTVSSQTITASPQTTAGRIAGTSVRYEGMTAMTVIGPVSGRVYRFSNPGSRVQPDPRDLSGLATISKLKFIR